MNQRQTNQLLGYPADARLLIINADDFGMCNSTNEAIIRSLGQGLVRSTTLMVPCPWALHAMHFLASHPEIPFGVHLTVISDPELYRWGPVSGRDKAPSLVDGAGYFYNFDNFHTHLPQVRLGELEVEFRAQIETVLAAGLHPTHLDWHAIRFGERTEIVDLMIRLAREYGLALRVIGRPSIEKVQNLGLPCIDYDFLDSYGVNPATKPAQYVQLLRELPAGLSEWAVHPGLDNSELLALEPANGHQRQSDYDFLMSPRSKEIVEEEGIILVDYRSLQPWWQAGV